MAIKGKTKITIDYKKCGDGIGKDPRECGICLRTCDPAIFLMHQTMGTIEEDHCDPQIWRITPLWLSLCSRCMKCVKNCPEKAISVSW